MKISTFLVGLALRLVAWHCGDFISWHVADLFVNHQFTKEIADECSFLYSRGGHYSRLCPNSSSSKALAVYNYVDNYNFNFQGSFVSLSSIILQCCVSLLLEDNFLHLKNLNTNIHLLYWLNPVIIISSYHSFIPYLLHFLILLIIFSSKRSIFILLATAYVVLLRIESSFIVCLPAIICLFASTTTNYTSLKFQWKILILGLLSIVITLLTIISTVPSIKNNNVLNIEDKILNIYSYRPSANIWWYFEAQMLSEYDTYFKILIKSQPSLYSIPLIIRFHDRPIYAVST